jgi:hypothetical protein
MAGRVRQACQKHNLAQRSTDALLTRDVGRVETIRKQPLAMPPVAEMQPLLFAS